MSLSSKNRNEQVKIIKELVKEHNVKSIVLQLVDILGIAKSITLPVSQLDKIIDNEVMFDGSSIDGFARIEESDMYLYPDLATFVILPWKTHNGGAIGRFICNVYTPDDKPFIGCPRNVLKRALEEAKKMGYTFYVGPEPEFYIFNKDEKGNPILESNDKAGYFDMAPLDRDEEVREAIIVALEALGFEVEASHHECGPGQHEIDFKYADALTTADNIMIFKYVVKRITDELGLFASFMPKPVEGIAGSGMHLNMSLFKDGKNIFFDPEAKNQLSDEAVYFVGGLLKHINGLTAITNPIINSYKRLVPGFEAPVYIAWSHKNRSPLVRIPAKRGLSTRVELRNPDPACNPYLALATVLIAGLDGIKNKIEPPKSVNQNIYDMESEERSEKHIESLPMSLYDAIMELEKNETVKEALGSHVTEKFISAKLREWNLYRKSVHEWEIEEYLRAY
ncbi:glutamate--ammonia ligase GlnA [Gottschalkia acidurici 9a]|uniref:Glutamine synthetase n=1 Tax=Gottschalkia acidurici (strain ATCC 7906 / DSM 604 / BCRC 14475 / CIP 104303 / KCTC 5404 / NCIMB 10678 / 9a) TaxID=1128398 RepID=K0B2D1_GOTA9|nr:type I glutamate--ammonia ligase [Gottschalkia acidurici]AFS79090.1 glutamate--ammonia ligase GlnA [Gottschalkia acidurici 9a]